MQKISEDYSDYDSDYEFYGFLNVEDYNKIVKTILKLMKKLMVQISLINTLV